MIASASLRTRSKSVNESNIFLLASVAERIADQFLAEKLGRAFHEFIKKRNSKCDVAIGRAINHSLLDELGAYRSDAVDLHSKACRNVARTNGARPQLGHGTQKILFSRCQSINRTRKKFWSRRRITDSAADFTTANSIGLVTARFHIW